VRSNSMTHLPPRCRYDVVTDELCLSSPDKNPGVKNIHDRFARLGVIAQILRSPEGRERYDVRLPSHPIMLY
jgi:hypothetical protein